MKRFRLAQRLVVMDRWLPALGVVAGLSLVLALLSAEPALAAGKVGAEPVPSNRWGSPQTMRPWAILGDSTHYDGKSVPLANTPVWFAADLAGGYLFTATGKGAMIHDVDASPDADPTSPAMVGYSYMRNVFPAFFQSDLKFYIYDISAPDANPNVFVTAGEGHGALIWDFSSRGNPAIHVQDYQHGPSANSVWAARIGTRDWAFFAAKADGVTIYDLTAASSYSKCDTVNGGCSDVFKRAIQVSGPAQAVHGTGTFLAVAKGNDGLELWNVSDPLFPSHIGSADPGGTFNDVALWQSGSKYFLAAINGKDVNGEYRTHIYDVSCVTSGSCSSAALSSPIKILSSGGTFMSELTLSQSEGRSYLYVGQLNRFFSGDQHEYLWDVTDPYTMDTSVTGPHELFPDNAPGKGYPGWYYALNATGFQNFAPMEAVVLNGHVYRAAWTVLDVHELLGAAPPVASFDWSPQPVYQEQEVSFLDQSGGAPTTWLWQFSGASPSSSQSTLQNPKVTFGAVGTASVTLSAANDAGPGDPVTKQVSVLDPKPVVGSVTPNPSSALVCQQVTLTANGVTGRPDLSYAWKIKNSSGGEFALTGNASQVIWNTADSNPGLPGDQPFLAGTYTAEVTVQNSAGTATKTSSSIPLSSPPPLAISSGPSTDPFNFGTVQFRATTAGAATWKWDFGDGTVKTVTTQAEGENPVHNYTETGTYTVTLTVDNCLETEKSASVQVTITQIDPLEINLFKARSQCQFGGAIGGCFQVNKAVTFDHSVSGSPDLFEYDWDGNGTWDQSSSTQVTTHTYTAAGTFLPKLRITRGTEPPVVVANGCTSDSTGCTGEEIIVSPAQPASVSISGASSGNTGQSLTFTASATNCTPSSTGWTWTATGLNVADTDASITISFSSSGSKTVSAKNSACGNATGTRLVSISSSNGGGDPPPPPPPPGGKPTAGFTFTPASPEAGKPVSFDGSPSTGNPTSYSWDFGDGSTGTGKTSSHTYGNPGTYAVKLTVSAPGDCKPPVGGLPSVCTDDEVKNVVVKAGNSVAAKFQDDADCAGLVGGSICSVETGREVTFTDASTGDVKARTWDFGDGETATGKTVTHAWAAPGSYKVTLTVENGDTADTTSKTYSVVGEPEPQTQPVVVPWIAQADPDKALHQTSDLNVHNPGDEPIEVRMTFRKRGLPEPDPPQVERTVPAGSTLHVPDAMKELFDRENISGFLFVEPLAGKAQPVVTTFNRTFTPEGQSFGQVVPGFPLGNLRRSAEGGTGVLHLVGLNDNGARQAYFGISNPNDRPLKYHLRFYDSLGKLVGGTSEPQGISRFGQKQYQVESIRLDFGVENADDYRIEIEPVDGSPEPFVYGANLRLVSRDPSFLRVGRTDLQEVFLVGALNTPGLNDSLFQTDVVLANTASSSALCDLTFTATGFRTEPTAPVTETIPPMTSVRLANVVNEWDVGNSVGVLRIACDGAGGVFPVVQGEGYDVSRPSEIYGQFMPALSADLAAEPGKPHSLVGLRQDAEDRTTLWLYNPADEVATYSVRYFDLDGNELGGESDVRLGRGKFRQINPGHHPPTIDGGFVVRVEVSSGKLLTAAQVVNAANDPAYIVGQ